MIGEMTTNELAVANTIQEKLLGLPQSTLHTHHTIHGGIYTRTIKLNKGETLTGALIRVNTTLIISGKLSVYIGNKVIEVNSYSVITAASNRKQVMYAREDSYITMLFKTDAKTVEEAEDEFTIESKKLMSRTKECTNTEDITGV